MQHLGDFEEDATVYIPFSTFSSNDPQASVTITDLVDADIKVHKDGGTTQIATDGATIAIDYDSITGNHLVTIDTSAHADYSVGSEYMVRIEGTTVDAGTINAWIGSFSIENRFMRGTDSAYTGTPPTAAAIVNEWETQSQADPTGFHVNQMEVNGTSQTANDNGADINTILSRVIGTLASGTHNPQTGDSYARIGATGSGLTSLAQASLVTAARMGALTDWIDGGRLDLLLDAIKVVTDAQAATGTGLSAIPWNSSWDTEVQSEVNDALVALGLDHLVSASVTGTDVADDSIIAQLVSNAATADWDTYDNTAEALQAIIARGDAAWTTGAGGTPPDLLQSTTIATLANQTTFTLTAGSADNKAYQKAMAVVTDQSTGTQKAVGFIKTYTGGTLGVVLYADPDVFTMAVGDTVDIIAVNTEGVWRDKLTDYVNGEAGKRLRGLTAVFVVEGTVNDASATTTSFITTLTGYGTDFFVDTEISIEIATDQWQPRVVTAYNTSTGEMVVDEALISVPADTSNIVLTMRHIHSISSINAEMDTALTDYAPATEAKQDIIDANVDKIPLSDGTNSWNATALAAINAEADTAISDAALATAANLATVDTVVDGIQADLDNGTDGLGALLAAINAVMTTQMSESYSADGAAPTPAQAIMLIQQMLTEFAISGTTLTAKKVDGSTTAATFTLDDDTNPTSLTRTT